VVHLKIFTQYSNSKCYFKIKISFKKLFGVNTCNKEICHAERDHSYRMPKLAQCAICHLNSNSKCILAGMTKLVIYKFKFVNGLIVN